MWDERYAGTEYVYGTQPNDFLAEMVDRIPAGPVLCLADGEGRNGVFVATRGHAVTSVDASSVGLAKARALAAERGVALETVQADLASFELGEGRWAGIVSIFCHLPPAIRGPLYAQVARSLMPGGVLVLEAYGPGQLGRGTGGPPVVEMMPDAATLEAEVPGLAWEHRYEGERSVVEGWGHTGDAWVVQLIGRRR